MRGGAAAHRTYNEMDSAPASTVAVASSRPRDDPEAALQHGTDEELSGGFIHFFKVRDPICRSSGMSTLRVGTNESPSCIVRDRGKTAESVICSWWIDDVYGDRG